MGADALKTLHGLREGGVREQDLDTELGLMRELFYGLYLLSCEDIGLKPSLQVDEPVDRTRCERFAADWLAHALKDADLGADTRVSVPIVVDPARQVTR